MKTAQGSISVDVSKFVAGIELATAKLLTLREALEKSSSVARSGFRIYDAVQAVASKLNSIKDQWKNISDAISFAKNISQNVPKIFDSIRSTAQGALNAIKNMPPLFQKLAVVVASAGIAFYALKKGMDAINSIGKSVASTIGSVVNKVTSLARAGVSSVGGVLSGVFGTLGSVAKTLGISIGGVGIALGALDRFFKVGTVSAFELGDEYSNLSKKTGASIPFLFDLGKMLKNNGGSADQASSAINNMQRALADVNELGQPTKEIFKQLKLNVDDLNQASTDEQVTTILQAISKLGTEADKTRAVTEIFGRNMYVLKAVMKDEAFSSLGKNFSSTGLTLAKNAETMARVATALRDSGSLFREFFIQMAGSIAPEILELLNLLSKGNALSDFGKKLGESIKKGLDVIIGAFKTGNLLEMLKTVFEIVSLYAQDLLTRAFTTASNILTKVFDGNVIPNLFKSFIDMFSGISEFLAGIFLRGFKEPILFFKNAFDNIIQEIVVGLSEGLINAVIPFSAQLKAAGINIPEKLGVRNVLEKAGFILSPENVSAKNEQNIDAQIAKATGKGTGISKFAEGAKSSFGVAKDLFGIISDELKNLGGMAPETAGKIAELTGKLNAYAVAAQASGVETEKATGGQDLGAKTKKEKQAQDAISSLQRIGGGGGAFGGDPMLKLAQDQLSEQKQQTAVLRQIAKNPSGFVSALMPNGQVAVFGG
ncbi:hypothetical protein EBR77_03625 [bacterium]|nr:hypothetical protein [bacterium]